MELQEVGEFGSLAELEAKMVAEQRKRSEPSKLQDIIDAFDEENREILLRWLRDPETYPNTWVSRWLRLWEKSTGQPTSVSHNSVARWRDDNEIRKIGAGRS